MGREVRKVPANWQHPKNAEGDYIPLLGGDYEADAAQWKEEYEQWKRGFRRGYSGEEWVEKDSEQNAMRFTEWCGTPPNPDDYMPQWPEEFRTHFMMYEDTSEGTPISPAFATAEELARWLVDNNASAFGLMGASYEGWLRVCNGGYAVSMVVSADGIHSGVDA